jgi:aminoglycoside phosphotransferase (APT) family kinase protein
MQEAKRAANQNHVLRLDDINVSWLKGMHMTNSRMHDNEVDTGVALVGRLLRGQFPQWADLPIKPIQSAGTDNTIYRLGDEMAARLPRIPGAVEQVGKEQQWLPRLAPLLPLDIPIPLAEGKPGEGYPWHWSVYRWLEGENATNAGIADPAQAARALAEFIASLQRIDSTGGPPPGSHNFGRGVHLAVRDAATRAAIATLPGMIDTDAATAAWEASLQFPAWNAPPVWIHGDLQSGNLLTQEGRLSAVIDFGGLGVGDPACDLQVAWNLFSTETREIFREMLSVDEATWGRGRGWALSVGVIALPYYKDTNPVLAGISRRAIDAVLADYERGG